MKDCLKLRKEAILPFFGNLQYKKVAEAKLVFLKYKRTRKSENVDKAIEHLQLTTKHYGGSSPSGKLTLRRKGMYRQCIVPFFRHGSVNLLESIRLDTYLLSER